MGRATDLSLFAICCSRRASSGSCPHSFPRSPQARQHPALSVMGVSLLRDRLQSRRRLRCSSATRVKTVSRAVHAAHALAAADVCLQTDQHPFSGFCMMIERRRIKDAINRKVSILCGPGTSEFICQVKVHIRFRAEE